MLPPLAPAGIEPSATEPDETPSLQGVAKILRHLETRISIKKHPVLLHKTGCFELAGEIEFGRKILLAELGFQILAYRKFYAFGSLDLDLFARLWVHARARLACRDFKSAKAD